MLTDRELEPYHFFQRTKAQCPSVNEFGTSPEDLALVTALIYFHQPKPA